MSDLKEIRGRTVERLRKAGFDRGRAEKMADSSVGRAVERRNDYDAGRLRKRREK